MRTAYKVRAYPDTEQATLLRRTFGCVRLVWNKTLADRQRRYTTEQKSTSYRETDAANAGCGATSGVSLAAGAARPTATNKRERLPARTPKCGQRAATSSTRPAPNWCADTTASA